MSEPWSTVIWALVVLTVVCTAILAALPSLLRRRGVEMRRTRFGLTLIFDSSDADGTPVRLLNVNGTFQSVSYVPSELRFELACEYHRHMAALIEERARAGKAAGGPALRVLVMGGGGYSLPKYLAAYVPSAHVEVVEIDPAITAIARESFFLDECIDKTGACRTGRLQLVNDDAWGYLQAQDRPFDVIVNDAFSGRKPLGPMETARGAHVVREHLAQDGVYLANVRCPMEGRRSKPLREVEVAFESAFGNCRTIAEWDDPQKPGCNVFVAKA